MPINNNLSLGAQRRHDVDAVRVIAFALLILYHIGMFYVADWGWHIKSGYQAEWLQLPMLVLNQWRMPIIFLVSGLAVSFAWGKYSPGVFALRRWIKLFIPLLFGMLVIVAPQNYYEALSNGAIDRDFLGFFGTYFTGGEFPAKAYDDADVPLLTWNHLWYLPYLLSYTLLLIPIAMFLRGPGCTLLKQVRRLRGIWLILAPIAPLMLYGTFIFPNYPGVNHGLMEDWYAHAMYFTFFFYGFLMGNDKGLWEEIRRLRKLTLLAAVLSFIAFYWLSSVIPDDSFAGHEQLQLVVIYLNRWLWIVMLLGWARALLDRPFRWLPYATEAVYPWYILHQTIIISIGYELSELQLGPVIEPLLVLLVTIVGCLVLHELLVRRFKVLRFLFGLKVSPVNHSSSSSIR